MVSRSKRRTLGTTHFVALLPTEQVGVLMPGSMHNFSYDLTTNIHIICLPVSSVKNLSGKHAKPKPVSKPCCLPEYHTHGLASHLASQPPSRGETTGPLGAAPGEVHFHRRLLLGPRSRTCEQGAPAPPLFCCRRVLAGRFARQVC